MFAYACVHACVFQVACVSVSACIPVRARLYTHVTLFPLILSFSSPNHLYLPFPQNSKYPFIVQIPSALPSPNLTHCPHPAPTYTHLSSYSIPSAYPSAHCPTSQKPIGEERENKASEAKGLIAKIDIDSTLRIKERDSSSHCSSVGQLK
jgi:hypothetical protein